MTMKSFTNTVNCAAGLTIFGLMFHCLYLTKIINDFALTISSRPTIQQSNGTSYNRPLTIPKKDTFPDVFIYRRSKKTASSSMLEALMLVLKEKDYVPIYHIPDKMPHVVRAESLKPNPRRLLVSQHNGVTRYHTRGRKAVIADTVIDGFKQITSFCRFVSNAEDCDDDMIRCLQSSTARAQVRYRWAGGDHETDDTYIDLPLSSAHPALSSTVLRVIFPGAVLDIKKRNVAGSACEETPKLQELYRKLFKELERQNDMLRKRLLSLAGYPIRAKSGSNITTEEMMDAAEEMEKVKYNFGTYEPTKHDAESHKELKQFERDWSRSPSGELVCGKCGPFRKA